MLPRPILVVNTAPKVAVPVKVTLPVTAPKVVVPVTSPKVVVPVSPRIIVTVPVTAPKVVVPVSPRIIVTVPVTSPKVVVPVTSPKVVVPAPAPRLVIAQVQSPKAPGVTLTPETIDEDTVVDIAMTLNQQQFADLLSLLDDYYHNDESLVSDTVYDELIDIYEAKYGPYNAVGAEPKGMKVLLPYYLGSLRKIKEAKDLVKYTREYAGPYIIQDKIDGLTLLLVVTMSGNRRTAVLYTRGGGIKGADVSHLLPYMNIPIVNETISVRGEVVITRENFARYGAGFKNARNMASGIVNAKKTFDPNMARILSFYAYRIMNTDLSAEQDILKLQELGFQVPSPVQSPSVDYDMLKNYYEQRKAQAPYEMDGLVVYQNQAHDYPVGSKPRHVIAFKIGTETAVTTVISVTWQHSRRKLLKPVVHYETVNLSGADLSKASGYNARFVVANNLGPGAKILLTRSGDVIPKILAVLSPAPSGVSLPDPSVEGEYAWDANQVEFVLVGTGAKVIARQLEHFIDTLGIKNMGPARVTILVNAGIDNTTKLLAATPQELVHTGVGPGVGPKFYTDLHTAIQNVSLAKILDASGFFPGVGERRFEEILERHKHLITYAQTHSEAEVAAVIRTVPGFNILADRIAQSLPDFIVWLQANPSIVVAYPQEKMALAVATLGGQTFVFSGFRDAELEAAIKARGGRVTTSVSRNTTAVIVKNIDDMTGKAQKAVEYGVQRILRDVFVREYLA